MSKFRAWSVLIALTVVGGSSCGPHVVYQHLTDSELLQQSPIIVVGRIEKLEKFWKEQKHQGTWQGRPLYWFHVNVRIAVENTLRGDVKAPSLEYTYWLPQLPTVGEWNSLMDGARYVHFLRRDGTHLRALVDFWPSAIRVTTGRHSALTQTGGLPQTIAQLLFQPGEDFDAARFNILLASRDSFRLVGESGTTALLEELARNSNSQIRAEACEELKSQWPAKHFCSE